MSYGDLVANALCLTQQNRSSTSSAVKHSIAHCSVENGVKVARREHKGSVPTSTLYRWTSEQEARKIVDDIPVGKVRVPPAEHTHHHRLTEAQESEVKLWIISQKDIHSARVRDYCSSHFGVVLSDYALRKVCEEVQLQSHSNRARTIGDNAAVVRVEQLFKEIDDWRAKQPPSSTLIGINVDETHVDAGGSKHSHEHLAPVPNIVVASSAERGVIRTPSGVSQLTLPRIDVSASLLLSITSTGVLHAGIIFALPQLKEGIYRNITNNVIFCFVF
jgi:hypothetical protein